MGIVVVHQVLVGDHPQGREQVRLEGEPGEPAGGADHAQKRREVVLSSVQHSANPPEVIQSEVVEVDLRGPDIEQVGGEALHGRWGIANPDAALPTGGARRFGQQPGGVGEVDQPGVGTQAAHALDHLSEHRDRSHRHGEPACAGGLLSQQAMRQGDALIRHAARHVADAKRRDDEGGAVQRLVEIDRRKHPKLGRLCSALSTRHGQHQRQSIGVNVHQGQGVQAEGVGAVDQRRIQQRQAHASCAQDGDLHQFSRTSLLRLTPDGRAPNAARPHAGAVGRARPGYPAERRPAPRGK